MIMQAAIKNRVVLTSRDRMMLTALVRCVKAFSVTQIKETWWPHGDPRARLRRLRQTGWVNVDRAVATIPTCWQRPIATWAPGCEAPDWCRVIAVSRGRWRTNAQPVSVVSASDIAAAHLGGTARYSRPSEVAHDLLLAAVYLHVRCARPRDARAWVGEGSLASGGDSDVAIPDALLRLPGRPIAIEVVGESYRPSKLRVLHEYCAAQGWGYELW